MSGLVLGVIASAMTTVAPPVGDFRASSDFMAMFRSPTDESSYAGNTVSWSSVDAREAISPIYGDGSLNVPNNYFAIQLADMIDIPVGDFTFEITMQKSGVPGLLGFFSKYGGGGNRQYRLYYYSSTNKVTFDFSSDGTNILTATFNCATDGVTSATLFNGAPHHVAVTRASGVITVWVDGFPGSTTVTNAAAGAAGGGLHWVGAATSSGSTLPDYAVAGTLFDEYRITIGTARYTAAFTPPSAPYGRNVGTDPLFAQVRALIGFNGYWLKYQAGRKAPAVTAFTGGSYAKSFNKFGIRGTSGFFFPWVAYIPEFDFGSANFTVEVFGAYGEGVTPTANGVFIGCWAGSTNLCWAIRVNASGFISFDWTTDGSTVQSIVTSVTAAANTNYNVAVTRSGTTLNIYVNGALAGTGTLSGTIFSPAGASVPLGILSGQNSGGNSNTNAMSENVHLRAIRVNKGLVRYTGASYTVPTLPLPVETVFMNYADTSTLMVMSDDHLHMTRASGSGTAWQSGRANLGHATGLYYFEVEFESWTTLACAGVNSVSGNRSQYAGYATAGCGWMTNGNRYVNGSVVTSGALIETWAAGDRLCIAVDATARKIWARHNNDPWNSGVAGTQDPATGAGGHGLPAPLSGDVMPQLSLQTTGDKISAKFSADYFKYAPPAGFSAWAP